MINDKFNRLTRYMSFDRFEDVCASGLFLANPTLFEDKQEGYVAVKSMFPDIDERALEKIEIMKSYFYVSSWYAGGEASEAMRKYGEICIETSWEQLQDICRAYGENNPTHNIIIGKIQYVPASDSRIGDRKPTWLWDCWSEKNYNPPSGFNLCSIKTFQGLFFKYDNFSYEQEVRLICDSFHGDNRGVAFKNAKEGVRMPLNASFFSRIILSADKSQLIRNRVDEVLKKYGYEAKLVKSCDMEQGRK